MISATTTQSDVRFVFALFEFICLNIYCAVFLLGLSLYCVPYVASFSGLSIFYCPAVFSNVYLC